jgi:CheY-like chemotaxis protein
MPKTALVADDNEIIRREICRILLSETECEVCAEAHDGLEAIEKAQQLHPNLVILDLSMPVMNGIEAARVLRARMPSVPIIMVTSHADFLMKELRSAGIAEMVSNFDISLLTQKAQSFLRQSAA